MNGSVATELETRQARLHNLRFGTGSLQCGTTAKVYPAARPGAVPEETEADLANGPDKPMIEALDHR
jgi:hypothetical protein